MKQLFSVPLKTVILASSLAFTLSSLTPHLYAAQAIAPPPVAENGHIREKALEVAADFRSLAKRSIPAVVSIKVTGKRKISPFQDKENPMEDELWQYFFGFPQQRQRERQSPSMLGQASGFLISADGLIMTNSHVVHDSDNIMVQLNDGREFSAKFLGEDANTDIALIKIESKDLPFLILGNSDNLEVGEWVAAIGNPLGLQATFSVGVVSAKGRNNLDILRLEDFIQTDAAIYKGNSGGPLLTLDGRVIGINTAIATNESSGYMGIGFAIPSNIARHVMDEILFNGKVSHGFIGVTLQSIDSNLAQSFGLKKVEGAIVTSVLKGSPAEKAGLKVEDIILNYNQTPIESAATLRNAAYMMKPGTRVTLTVLRNDQTLQIPVEIGNFKEDSETASAEQSRHTENTLGVEVTELTPEIAKNLGYTAEKGVVISKVAPSGAAAFAGIKKGALILSVNRKKVETVTQFNEALKSSPKGTPVLVQIKQGNLNAFLSIKTN